jgi:ATP-binding protein involved in chromosome partitioning
MTMPLDKQQVLTALRTVQDPELFKDIVTLNMVKDVQIDGDSVTVKIELTTAACPLKDVIERDVTVALGRIGARQVKVDLTAPEKSGSGPRKAPGAPARDLLPQVKFIIAVGAGKGGVGKSTLALNLAIGLHRTGAAVGLMDGDIYGPSMPTMLGIKGVPPRVHGSRILPHEVHGIHAVTIGSLVEPEKALIWRGPMAHGAFKQLLLDNTEWPELEYLIVDLPPGTGDVPLTLCQLLPLTGAVIVATPQRVALDDAVRAVRMFEQLGAPILGIIENMSYVPLPDGSIYDLLGRGGAKAEAARLGVPFLGELPTFKELRINSDLGRPHDNFDQVPALRQAIEAIVVRLREEIAARPRPGGTLEVE